MLRFSLDTNVVLDIFQNDRVHHADSPSLFKAASAGRAELTVAPITLINAIYVLRKGDTPLNIAQKMKGLLLMLRTVETSREALLMARTAVGATLKTRSNTTPRILPETSTSSSPEIPASQKPRRFP